MVWPASFNSRPFRYLLLMWVLLVPHLALAQIQGSDVLSISGQYDRFAVDNAHRWYDKHSADARQKSTHCLSILDEAHAIQDTALALDEEARRPGLDSCQATALRKRANEQFGLRDKNIGAFIDCFNQSNRRPMLQGRVERNEVPPDRQPDSGKQPDPRRRKAASPPPRRVPPPNDPGPAEPATLPIPPSPDSGDQKLPPGGATNQRPGRHRFGTPDPPFIFADGVFKGMGDCFAENLPSDLARVIHERFCCNRRFTAATGLWPTGSPLGSSTYCTSTRRVRPAPRAGLAT